MKHMEKNQKEKIQETLPTGEAEAAKRELSDDELDDVTGGIAIRTA